MERLDENGVPEEVAGNATTRNPDTDRVELEFARQFYLLYRFLNEIQCSKREPLRELSPSKLKIRAGNTRVTPRS
jgi:hypothetical protein